MTKIQTANAWASTDDDFKHQYKWYNKSMLKISNFLLFAYHIWGIYSWVANKSSYENSLEQSSFFGVKYIVLLVPILKTIALINIMFERNVSTYGAMLITINCIHLAIIPLPHTSKYHIEWAAQFIKIISILTFIAAINIKENGDFIIEGTPSYGIYIALKLIPLAVISIFIHRFGVMAKSDGWELTPNMSFTSLIILFWVYAFFHRGYECPIYALFACLVLGWYNDDLVWDLSSKYAGDINFLFLGMITYLYSASLTSYPFKKHQKNE